MVNKSLSPLVHTLLLYASLLAAFTWLHIPGLKVYSLQAFAATIGLYFLIKRVTKSEIWHIAPSALTFEMGIITFAFTLLIGATGNLDSLFYPLAYIHLFFLTFSTETSTSIAVAFGLVAFHYALGNNLSPADWADLLTLPLTLLFFLFTKAQYHQVIKQKYQLAEETKLLQHEEQDILGFFHQSLKPQLDYLQQVGTQTPFSDQILESIAIINQEVASLENHLQLKPTNHEPETTTS